MPTHFLLKLPVSFLIIFHNLVTVILLSTPALGEDDHRYTECRGYYDCGLLKNISYPFWATSSRPQHCGREDYELTCREDQYPVMKIKEQDFLVLNFSRQVYTMTIARSDLWDTPCTDNIVNTTLDYDRFSYVPAVRYLTLLYGCQPGNMSVLNNFTCKIKGMDGNISYYVDDSLSRIRMGNWTSCYLNIRVPIMWEALDAMPLENVTTGVLKEVLKQGFQVAYDAEWELCQQCVVSNGTCGSNSSSDSFVCYCGDGPYDRICSIPGDNAWNWKRKVIVGAALSAGSGIMICVIVCSIKARKQIFRSSNDQDLEAFIRANGPLAVKRYKFLEIRKMTKSFKDKLGQGGYGDVYKGNLLDGSPVAVKVLKASKGNGEDFINEVLSISRTSHVNVVTLLGYCFEGQKKALIYEFMPNGSLEKYVYNENA